MIVNRLHLLFVSGEAGVARHQPVADGRLSVHVDDGGGFLTSLCSVRTIVRTKTPGTMETGGHHGVIVVSPKVDQALFSGHVVHW